MKTIWEAERDAARARRGDAGSVPRITGPTNLRKGDIVVRLGQERTVTTVVRQLDDTVVHYTDGPPDTFGIGTTVLRRRPARRVAS